MLLPFVKAEFHLTFAQAGLLANLSFVGGFVTIAFAGWAVDALGDRVVLVVSGVVTGVAAVVCGLAPTFAVILGALLVMGAGISMSTPAGSLAVRSAFSLRLRGTVMSIRQTGIPIGAFFAAVTLPSIALSAGWRDAVVAAGAASIVVAIGGLAIYRAGPRARNGANDRWSMRQVLTRDIAIAGTGGMLLAAGQFCVLTYLVAYLIHDRGIPITIAALYLALAQLAGAIGRVLWGVVSDRLLSGSRRPALLLAGGTGAVGSLALATIPAGYPLPLTVVAILACAVGAVGWNGVQISMLSELAGPGREGRSVGLALMIQYPGILGGPFVFGLVVDTTGSFRLAWLVLAGLLGIAVLIMSAVRETPQLEGTA